MQPQGLVPLNSNVDLLLHMCCSLKTAYWNPLNSNVDLLLPDYEIIYELRNHPLNSNVDLLLLLSPFIALHSIKTLNSNVDLLLPCPPERAKTGCLTSKFQCGSIITKVPGNFICDDNVL